MTETQTPYTYRHRMVDDGTTLETTLWCDAGQAVTKIGWKTADDAAVNVETAKKTYDPERVYARLMQTVALREDGGVSTNIRRIGRLVFYYARDPQAQKFEIVLNFKTLLQFGICWRGKVIVLGLDSR